jgi:tetratricopeptide (TPR) repeat protein
VADRYALYASASYYDQVVEETYVRQGRPLQLGNSPALAIPVPAGVPYIARVSWTSDSTAVVVDGRGQQHLLSPEQGVHLQLGAVSLDLSLAPQFLFRRITPPSLRGMLPWFAIVSLASVLVNQTAIVLDHWCDIGGAVLTEEQWVSAMPYCFDSQTGEQAATDYFTAEYLERLLKKDYAGDDEGAITRDLERDAAEKKAKEIYIPAGADGPDDDKGGAEDQAPEPVRTPEVEDEVPELTEGAPDVQPLYADEDVGTAVDELPELTERERGDGVVELEPTDEELDDAPEPPAEEKEGWGVPDWYDEEDATQDMVEVEVMLSAAKRLLRIDPDSAYALSVLSYYQYLAMDYDAAERTYDRYIELYPDDAAGYNNKALIFKRKGDYGTEENLYRIALSLEPNDVTALNNLAVVLAHQKRYDEALAVMAQLELLDPKDPYADLHRSKIYADMGETESALEYLDAALRGMKELDTLHHIEFRQDIRVDPSFEVLRKTKEFRELLWTYYGEDTPLQE